MKGIIDAVVEVRVGGGEAGRWAAVHVGAGVENWKGDCVGDIFDDHLMIVTLMLLLMFMLMFTK